MEKQKEIVVISGFMGFAIGVCSMMIVNIDKEARQIERFDDINFTISENINTCEDLKEWIVEDVASEYVDSVYADSYIDNLEIMIENNRNILLCNEETPHCHDGDLYWYE